MADALGTVLTVIEVVNKTIDVYHKIHDCPDQMRLIGERMEQLGSRLTAVEVFLRKQTIDDSRNAVLVSIVGRIRVDSRRVEDLFRKFREDIGPFGYQFRFKILTQVFFAMGSNAEELRDLAERIEKHRLDLREELQFLVAVGVDKANVGIGQILSNQLQAQHVTPGGPAQRPTVPRANHNVIFVDPYNEGRSVAAEAYLNLVREWTVGTGGEWRINLVHSAGFFVRSRGDAADLVENLDYQYPSFRLSVAHGNKPPNATALAALFDNNTFGYPFKERVKARTEARRSRGISKTIFKTYDYIVVFTTREFENLARLRRALAARDGKGAVAAGGGGGGGGEDKGRVVYLGDFRHHGVNKTPQEIWNPADDGDRAQWNEKVGQIKVATKAFLKREVGWKQPDKGAKLCG